ncbi:MAG: HEAT repeat domain-containing protein [Verrucomicrobiota bacterium]
MKTGTISTLLLLIGSVMVPLLQADEASALKVLADESASLHDKAMACDELGRVGTAKAVPALAPLLADEQLHDYARDGLERIPDPAAGKALLASWKDLKHSQRIGVIISLGDRGEKRAVPRLAKIAKGKNEPAAGAALTSLAQIATKESVEALLAAYAEGGDERQFAAKNAIDLAVQKLEQADRNDEATELRKAISAGKTAAVSAGN